MEKTYLQEVGERVRVCRNRRFISKVELSKLTGVSVNTITKMEKGKEAIGFDEAVKICESLQCSTEYIFTGNCGILELVKMNLKILNMPSLYSENLQKVASAFWATCPRYYK